MKKRCPACGRTFTGQEIYCAGCGSLLEYERNKCSENRTELCRTAMLTERDRFCPFCRAPTTYALAERDGDW